MPATASSNDDHSDHALLAASRDGDREAFALLFSQYRPRAEKLAAMSTRRLDPQDVAAEAFCRIWSAFLRGGGPRDHFAAYLDTTVRNIVKNACTRAEAKETPSEPEVLTSQSMGQESWIDDVMDPRECGQLRDAFASLPLRWQQVLWLLSVKQLSTAETATELGLSNNATSALAVRAREGLRAALLRQADERQKDECRWLASLQRSRTLTRTESARVQAHLEVCHHCTTAHTRVVLTQAALVAA